MGNALKCFKGEEDHHGGARDHYVYYQPRYHSHDPPAAGPRPHQQALGFTFTPATVGDAAVTQVRIHIHGNKLVPLTYSVLPSFRSPFFVSLVCNVCFVHTTGGRPCLEEEFWGYDSLKLECKLEL